MCLPQVHAAVKEKNPTWQVSQDRVKKILSEMVVAVAPGKLVKGATNKNDPTLKGKELAKAKTAAALAKKKEEAKNKNVAGAVAGGPNKADIGSWRPGGDISH